MATRANQGNQGGGNDDHPNAGGGNQSNQGNQGSQGGGNDDHPNAGGGNQSNQGNQGSQGGTEDDETYGDDDGDGQYDSVQNQGNQGNQGGGYGGYDDEGFGGYVGGATNDAFGGNPNETTRGNDGAGRDADGDGRSDSRREEGSQGVVLGVYSDGSEYDLNRPLEAAVLDTPITVLDVPSTPTYDNVREAEAAERLEQLLADPETRELFEGLTEAEQMAVLSELNRAQQEEDPPSADSVRDALTHSDAAATLTPEQRELLADQIEGLLEAGAGPEGVLAAIEQSEAVAHMSVEQKTMLAMDVLGGGAQPASADTSGVAAPVENLLGGGTAIERAQPPEYWDQVKADYLKSPNAPEDATEWRQEADAAVARAVQEFREQGYSPGALAAAERTLREAVGSGQSEQEQSNIARMKDLTRGQVWTDTGEGYEQTDPDADVQIGIDAQGNVVGSTTSRPVPDTEWDRFLASEEARLLAENAARRAGDPNNPIDQRAAAFGELKDVAGPEGFSSAEFEAFAATGRLPDRLRPATVSGGGNQAAGTEQLLSAGPDLPAPADGQSAASVERAFTPEFVAYAEKYGLTPEQLQAGMDDAEASGDFDGVPRAYAEETLAEADRTGETPSEVLERKQEERAAALEAVAFAQSDRMGYLESKGYDGDAIENMSQAEIDTLIDVNVASDQQAVAAAQSDRMGYLESKGYDGDAIENMSQAEIDTLIDVNVASDQQAGAAAQSDVMGYLESKGYDADTIENMSQAEMMRLVDVNVASDRQAVSPASRGQADCERAVGGHGVSGGEGLRRRHHREHEPGGDGPLGAGQRGQRQAGDGPCSVGGIWGI